MVQLRVGDIILDTYEFDPPKLNFNIEDISDTATKSEFTRTFRIPATPNNNEFFETAFEINGQDFDVTVKIQCDLYVNGNLFRRGELRLQNIYITRENERIDYECVFFGTVRNLSASIGEGTLNQLDLSEYNHTLFTDTIVDSWQAYPEGGNTAGIFNGDIIYPLVDFGNTYDDTGAPENNQGEIAHTNAAHSQPFTNQLYALERERFKPWIRAKAIWDAIFDEAGFTYTSEFIEGDEFRNLYIGAHGNTASIYVQALANTARASDSGISGGGELELTTPPDGFDPGGNIVGGRYIVPSTGSYLLQYNLSGDGFSDGPVNITLRLRNGTTTISSVSITTGGSDFDPSFSFALGNSIQTTLTAGDEINLFFDSDEQVDFNGRLQVIDAPGEVSIAPLLPNDYKKLDFVKDIIAKHRLVLAPDKNNITNFIVTPWTQYIGTGDEFDWTHKLDVSKDFKISPLFYTQKSKIHYTDKEGGDEYNQIHLDQFEEVFGALNVFTNNELLEGEREIKTNAIPLVVTQIRGAEEDNNGMDNTIIPQLNIFDPQDTGTQHQPIVSKNRFGYYNGIKDTSTSGYTSDTWYVEADGGGTTGFTNYPMISPYSIFPIEGSTLDFNWQREPGYIQFGLHDENIGNSMYDRFWSLYINSLYDKWARRVTAYFVLNAEDLINFSYDDVVFVKDAYYYVEKIYDVPMGEKASVKVDLIKIISPRLLRAEPLPRSVQYDARCYFPTGVKVVGENLTNISGDRYTVDLSGNSLYEVWTGTTTASTTNVLFYENTGASIYPWRVYGLDSGTIATGNTLSITGPIATGDKSTFRTSAFVPDSDDVDINNCPDITRFELVSEPPAQYVSGYTGTYYYQGFAAAFDNISGDTYTVNCTADTKYDVFIANEPNYTGIMYYDTYSIPPSPSGRTEGTTYFGHITNPEDLACGNTVEITWWKNGSFSCDVGSLDPSVDWCQRGTRRVPDKCKCGPQGQWIY